MIEEGDRFSTFQCGVTYLRGEIMAQNKTDEERM